MFVKIIAVNAFVSKYHYQCVCVCVCKQWKTRLHKREICIAEEFMKRCVQRSSYVVTDKMAIKVL